MAKEARIALWNANGLKQRLRELELFMNLQKIDICLISETHYTKHSYVKIKGYNAYHTSHPDDTAKGGTAILIKDTIKHYEEQKFITEWLQAKIIKVYLEGRVTSRNKILITYSNTQNATIKFNL